jgi:CMP-N-acetylneuraminic acid synthetase
VIYEDTVFNIFSRSAFKRNGNKKFGKNPMFYEVPEIENLSVETPTSFKLVKLVYENQGQIL